MKPCKKPSLKDLSLNCTSIELERFYISYIKHINYKLHTFCTEMKSIHMRAPRLFGPQSHSFKKVYNSARHRILREDFIAGTNSVRFCLGLPQTPSMQNRACQTYRTIKKDVILKDKKINDLILETKSLKDQLTLKNLNIEHLTIQKDFLKKEIADLQKRNLHFIKSNSDISQKNRELKTQLTDLETQLTDLNNQLKILNQQSNNESDSLEQLEKAYKNEKDGLFSELTVKNKEIDQLTTEKYELCANNERLNNELKMRGQSIAQLEIQQTVLQESYNTLEKNYLSEKDSARALASEQNEMKIIFLENEKSELSQKITVLENTIKKMKVPQENVLKNTFDQPVQEINAIDNVKKESQYNWYKGLLTGALMSGVTVVIVGSLYYTTNASLI